MSNSTKTEAERAVQRQFRIAWLVAGAFLAFLVLLFRAELNRLPNRVELGPRAVPLRFEPVALGTSSVGPFQVVGSWRLFADDSRFGGISGLAVDGDSLVAVTDSGVIARFPRPDGSDSEVSLRELPDGPGQPGFKVNRDSEALLADPAGGGWWIAFENRDELWLYDRGFRKSLRRVALNRRGLARNRGIEGVVSDGAGLLLFPERGGRAIGMGKTGNSRILGIAGWLSEAVRLPGGQLLVINRRPTPVGLTNDLVVLGRKSADYRAAAQWRLPVGRLDNVEGLAAERMPGGAVRLWVMTDNNFQRRHPTLLIALELRPRPAR
jgi:hypothetical protein